MITLSFYKWDLLSGKPITYIGLDNYISIFKQDINIHFWKAFKNTIIYSFSVSTVSILIGFLLAILLHLANCCNVCAGIVP